MSAWEGLYSKAARGLKPSPTRELMHVIRKPGMISFAGGMPDPQIFPVDLFCDCAEILKKEGKDILQYGTTEGYQPLKEFLSEWLAPRLGRKADPSKEILIVSGSTQVADLISWALVDPGDYVIVEEPTFFGFTIPMYNHGAQFLTVPCDSEGMKVDLLPGLIEKAKKEGKKVAFIYTIPNFHNPLGCTLSLDRRKKLVEISHSLGVPILEDDPYGYLRFEGKDVASIFSLDGGTNVIHSGTFSKILAPGTRVAWCVGDADIIRKMAVFKQGTDLCTSVVAQGLVYEYCRRGHLDSFLPKIVNHYRKKRDDMEEALKRHLPLEEVSWVKPQGGFFYWIEMKNILTKDLFDKAIEKKVAFVPGEPFYPSGKGGERAFRMCFTFATPEDTDEGIKRLGEAIRELM